MTTNILSARQLPCNGSSKKNNKKDNGASVKNGAKIQLCIEADDQLRDRIRKVINEITTKECKVPDKHTKTEHCKYLSFSSAQKIIHQLLTHDKIVLVPTVVSGVTESELAKELNITLEQLVCLRKSSAFYKKVARHINLSLINLYCSSTLQPRLLHTSCSDHRHEGVL